MIEIEGKQYKIEQIQTAIAMCVLYRGEKAQLPSNNDYPQELWFDQSTGKFMLKRYTVVGQKKHSDNIECGSEIVEHTTYEDVVFSEVVELTKDVLDGLYEAYVPINWTL